MKRLGFAVFCALLLHAGLLWIDPDWFMGDIGQPTLSRFVTVTMSYREAPEKKVDKEEAQLRPTETPPVETIKKPESPVSQKSLKPRVAKPEGLEPLKEKEGEVKEEASASSREERSSDAAMVREAFPLYKVNTPPRYPRSARRRGQQGTVVLSVHVDASGRVTNLRLFESSGHRALDNAALDAVKKWSFEPGRRGDMAVAMWVNVPVRFELQ
jgi:protein TonB